MLPAGGPSPAHTCGAVLVAAVLLQSVCVAVTYIYFTNELKQVGAGPGRRGPGGDLLLFLRQVTVSLFLLHGVCKRGSRAQLRARPPPLPPPPHRMSRRQR